MDSDGFVLSIYSSNIIEDLQNLEVFFDSSILNENHEFFSSRNQKVLGKIRIQTSKNVFVDEFVCLRSKMYEFECGEKIN